MEGILQYFFKASAWPMEAPRPYSGFHILFGASGILAAGLLACKLAKRPASHVLFISGLVLAAIELYKQGFLYYAVNSQTYDWWYFPFQLCSVPMYLGILYPAIQKQAPKAAAIMGTFIQDFALLGGFMALAEPSGLMHPYWVLTLHGFIWHFILICMGLYCALSGTGSRKAGAFVSTLPLLLGCSLIATLINVASHPYGNADMFYISPYYPNEQIVFHEIALTIGILPGNLLYLSSVALGGWIFHMACRLLTVQSIDAPF